MEALLLLLAYFALLSAGSSLVITRLLPGFGKVIKEAEARIAEKAEKSDEVPPPVQVATFNGGLLKSFGIGGLYSVSLVIFVLVLFSTGVLVEGAGMLMGILYNLLIMIFSGAFLVALSKVAPKSFSIGSTGFAWTGGVILFFVFYLSTMLFGLLLMGLGLMPPS